MLFWKNTQFSRGWQVQTTLQLKMRNFFGRVHIFCKNHSGTKHWILDIFVHKNVVMCTKYSGDKTALFPKFPQFPANSRFWQFCEISGNFLAKKIFAKIFENFRKFLEISGKNFRENFAEIFVRSCRCQKIFDKLYKNFFDFSQKFLESLKINFQKKESTFIKKEKLFLKTPTGQNFAIAKWLFRKFIVFPCNLRN